MLDLLMQYGEMFSIIMFFIPAIFSMLVFYFLKTVGEGHNSGFV